MLKPGAASGEGDEALECYAKHTAQIEVTTHTGHVELKQKRWRMWGKKTNQTTCGRHCSDCASGPHHGGDRVPRAKHLRVPDHGV